MKKKKQKKPAVKRAAGKKLFNFAWSEDVVNGWKSRAQQENRTLTNLIETVMNNYCRVR